MALVAQTFFRSDEVTRYVMYYSITQNPKTPKPRSATLYLNSLYFLIYLNKYITHIYSSAIDFLWFSMIALGRKLLRFLIEIEFEKFCASSMKWSYSSGSFFNGKYVDLNKHLSATLWLFWVRLTIFFICVLYTFAGLQS